MKRIMGLLYWLLRDVLKEFLIKAGIIVVWLYHSWVSTSLVDTSVNHASDIIYVFGFNLG